VVVDSHQFDRVALLKRRDGGFQQYVKLAVDGAGCGHDILRQLAQRQHIECLRRQSLMLVMRKKSPIVQNVIITRYS
jgi:hypothetical protein